MSFQVSQCTALLLTTFFNHSPKTFLKAFLYKVRKIFTYYLPPKKVSSWTRNTLCARNWSIEKRESSSFMIMSTHFNAGHDSVSHTLSHCFQSHLLTPFFLQYYRANDTSTTKMLFIFLYHHDHRDSTKEGWENIGSNNFSGKTSSPWKLPVAYCLVLHCVNYLKLIDEKYHASIWS